MQKKFYFFVFLFFCCFTASALKAEGKNIGSGMNIKIGNEYVGLNAIESKYLAYTKVKEAEKTLFRLKQTTGTFEFLKKTTAEQREEIDKKIQELEEMISSVNDDDDVTDKEYVKIQVKLQSIIDEIDMIDNIMDHTYGFAPKFMLKTGILVSSRYVFVAPIIADLDILYQLNKFANPFIGIGFTVPILLNHRNDILTSGNNVSAYAMLVEGRFGNLFKFDKNHYVSLFFKIGGLLGHQSKEVPSTAGGSASTASEKVITRTNPLGESAITGVGLEYFFRNKLVVGINFDVYNASSDSPVKKKTNFVLGFNIGYNFCSGNKSRFSTNSSGRTNIYKTIWE